MLQLRTLRTCKAPLAVLGIALVGLAFGTRNSQPTTVAAERPAAPVVPVAGAVPPSDYSQRVVAYIHGNIPITREDLGEFLIARHGYSKLELLVNRRIIEHACQQKNIIVTDAEIEHSLNETLKPMNMDRATFVKQYLKQYNKTLYEWKEDVIRPELQLKKLMHDEIKVDEAELKKLFEAKFGEKVRCRIILWKEGELRNVRQLWDNLRKSDADFETAARRQYIPALASVGGLIDPIGRGAAENDFIEKIAFGLQPGEVSQIFPIKEQGSIAVLKCDGREPPAKDVSFDKERDKLHKMVFDQKLAKAIPVLFKKLKDEAKPLTLVPYGTNNPGVIRTNEEESKLLKQEEQPLAPLPKPDKK